MRIRVTAVAGLVLAGLAASSALAQVADLKIRVLGAETAEGTVEISLRATASPTASALFWAGRLSMMPRSRSRLT